MLNIREVAKKAGVSTASVSRYIDQSGIVSQSTSDKIQVVLDEYKYVPNRLTSALINGSSFDIALIVQNIMNPFFSELVEQVEKQMRDSGYNLVICNCQGNPKSEVDNLKCLVERRVAGVVVINTSDEQIYDGCELPIIAIDKPILSNPVIMVDNNHAIKELINALDINDKKALIIRGDEDHYSATKRFKYLTKYLDNYDQITLTDDVASLVKPINIDYHQYDIIFCWNDIIAHRIYKDASLAVDNIPSNLELVGFDGLLINGLFGYELTTVDQGIKQLASVAVGSMIDRIKGHQVSDTYLKPKVVLGSTTK